MRIKILLAVVLTLSLILSGCAEQPVSEQLVQEKLAVILTQSALQEPLEQPTQPALPEPPEQPAVTLPTHTPAPASTSESQQPPAPTPDASIVLTDIRETGPGQAIVKWEAYGNFPSGYALAWTSEQRAPIYPKDEDAYVGDPNARSALISGEQGKVYIVSVCRYVSDSCDIYSNLGFFAFKRYAPTPTPNRTATARALTPISVGGGGGGSGGKETPSSAFTITYMGGGATGKAQMTWKSDSNPSGGFRIYYSTSNQDPAFGKDSYFSISDGKVREAYVPGSSGTTYYYRLCKFNGSSCDAYTASFKFTFPGVLKPTLTPDPSAILIATVEDVDVGQAKITWAASGDFPQGFKVMYSEVHAKPDLSDTVVPADGAERSALVEGKPSTTYYFRVCKYDGSKCTLTSSTYTFTFAPIPEDPAFVLRNDKTVTEPGRVLLLWDALVPKPVMLYVLWSTSDKPVFPKDILDKIDGDATSYDTNDKLIPGKSYNFRLCKYNGSTCTEYSNALQVTAPEDKP
ncbi:MAG: Fibronectin type III domain protein [Chloroflexi bacterium ADurb.Bin222]|jgi:hypothetical protein|nr:MAG: Fibronectin type III domain protein [Chloroflexi bacterium ADurb.Bin222]